MKTAIQLGSSTYAYLPYEDLSSVFKEFKFETAEYLGEGIIVQQTSGFCKYARIKIVIEKLAADLGCGYFFSWEVTDEQIPFFYFDTILATIKRVIKSRNKLSLNFRIIEGSYHEVDSNCQSFEIATFRAMANALQFDFQKSFAL